MKGRHRTDSARRACTERDSGGRDWRHRRNRWGVARESCACCQTPCSTDRKSQASRPQWAYTVEPADFARATAHLERRLKTQPISRPISKACQILSLADAIGETMRAANADSHCVFL